jgi:single-strand DNA-binding protein
MSGAVMVTLVGWAATGPREVVGDKVPFTSFRLACTERTFDRRTGEFVDRGTEWFTVKAFRDVAHNVAASVRKGDPVLVHGRLSTQEWEGERGTRTTLVVEASAIGLDLTKGKTLFSRTVRATRADGEAGPEGGAGSDGPGEVEVVPAGAQLDEHDPWQVELDEVTDAAAARPGPAGAGPDDTDLEAAVAALGEELEPVTP